MAGTFPGTANTQQHDVNGQPLAGGLLTVYQGGSTSALAVTYQDIGLVLPSTNPLVADASGRIPLFFVPDGSYGLRLTDKEGIQSNGGFFYPQVPSIGASSSGGGGTPVDPTTVAQTADVKWRLENATITGWVRINGRTIGNAASGASERANADAQALFIYIWSTYADAICPVPGGRGANALADFNANKQITLLSARGRDIRGLDDMGNAAAGAFTGVAFQTGTATTGGASCGVNSTTLSLQQIPTGITSTGATGTSTARFGGKSVPLFQNPAVTSITAAGGVNGIYDTGGPSFVSSATTGTVDATTAAVTSNNTGGQAFPSVPSALLGTLFWKL